MKLTKLLDLLLGKYLVFSMADEAGGGADGGTDPAAAADSAVPEAASTPEPAAEKPIKAETKVSDAEAKLLKEVMDKKNALKKAQDELQQMKQQLKEFDGIDVGAVKKMLADQKAAEEAQLEAKGEFSRLKQQMQQAHQAEIDALKAQMAEAEAGKSKLAGTIAELTVGNAFAMSPFIKDELTLTASKARVVYGSHFEFVDGQVIGFDKPAGASERTMLVDAKGDPLAFEAALRKLVEVDVDRDQLLKSKVKPGAASKTAANASVAAPAAETPRGKEAILMALAKGALQVK